MRIISVVPSLTELLYDLGLEDEVIGITKFCVHPSEWFRNKQRVGGTKDLKIDLIKNLKPDLIIANKEENSREDILKCQQFCEVFVTDIATFDDALFAIRKIGNLTGRSTEAAVMADEITEAFKGLQIDKAAQPGVVYLIWKDPLMSVGGDTFISEMLSLAGFKNLFSASPRYPVILEKELSDISPEMLMLSSEPFPFSEKHRAYFENLVPTSKILFVDGEMFSWYGSRMRLAAPYFMALRDSL